MDTYLLINSQSPSLEFLLIDIYSFIQRKKIPTLIYSCKGDLRATNPTTAFVTTSSPKRGREGEE